jgi:phosphatidylinositol glycan class V
MKQRTDSVRTDALARTEPPKTNTHAHIIWKLVQFTTATRLVALILGWTSHQYISDYDMSATLVLNTLTESQATSERWLDAWIRPLLTIFLRWDTFYFLHIAEEGYIFEQEHAFFPLLPMLTRFTARYRK